MLDLPGCMYVALADGEIFINPLCSVRQVQSLLDVGRNILSAYGRCAFYLSGEGFIINENLVSFRIFYRTSPSDKLTDCLAGLPVLFITHALSAVMVGVTTSLIPRCTT